MRVLFLDRDDVINHDNGYTSRVEDFTEAGSTLQVHILPGYIDRQLRKFVIPAQAETISLSKGQTR